MWADPRGAIPIFRVLEETAYHGSSHYKACLLLPRVARVTILLRLFPPQPTVPVVLHVSVPVTARGRVVPASVRVVTEARASVATSASVPEPVNAVPSVPHAVSSFSMLNLIEPFSMVSTNLLDLLKIICSVLRMSRKPP